MNPLAPVIVDALEAVFATTNNYHRSARALRNRLIVMSLVALCAVGLLILLQWRVKEIVIVQYPKDVRDVAPWVLLLVVMAFGAIGALLTTIRPISTLPPTFSPFNFPLQQALLKIIIGMLTGTIGVVLVSGATTGAGFNSLPALLAAAAAFGAGQQAVTRMLDDRAQALASTSPSNPSAPS